MTPKHASDPKLQTVAEELKAVLRKHDVAAAIVLASGNGHGEYVNWITEPTWSALSVERVEQGLAVRFRARPKGAPVAERLLERVKLKKTVNMLWVLVDVLRMELAMLDGMKNRLEALYYRVESEPGTHTPADEE